MPDTPSYLKTLEYIANAERQGYEYYKAWYDHAQDPDLKETMRFVMNRELEHSLAFTKRIDELGFCVEPKQVIDFTDRIACVSADTSDWEKIKGIGLDQGREYLRTLKKDAFSNMFDDMTIDPQTGALLGRYIAEERDSTRILIDCAEVMRERYAPDEPVRSSRARDDRMDVLEEKLDTICAAVEQLTAAVAAKSPVNGKTRAKVTA